MHEIHCIAVPAVNNWPTNTFDMDTIGIKAIDIMGDSKESESTINRSPKQTQSIYALFQWSYKNNRVNQRP